SEVAKAALAGCLNGDFYIVTHSHAIGAAEKRMAEIRSAFANQAPMERNGDIYEVNRVIADVLAERSR
ncbi:MAG: hypothetical protein ACKOXK_11780, partial [Chakrabartia sp.]